MLRRQAERSGPVTQERPEIGRMEGSGSDHCLAIIASISFLCFLTMTVRLSF